MIEENTINTAIAANNVSQVPIINSKTKKLERISENSSKNNIPRHKLGLNIDVNSELKEVQQTQNQAFQVGIEEKE